LKHCDKTISFGNIFPNKNMLPYVVISFEISDFIYKNKFC
jgi:hypothetical protein